MNLKPFNLEELDIKDYYFIAHLYSSVLIGRENEYPYEELIEAIDNDEILEVHLFNENKEIYATRINGKLMAYKPLEHKEVSEEQVVLRSYQLEKKGKDRTGKVQYDTLQVKEYIEYDANNYLAYVDKTVLYSLTKEGETDGKPK